VQHRKLPIYEQGTVIFRTIVAQHLDVRPRVQRLLLAAVRGHRDGAPLDASLVRGVLAMLVELGVYVEDWEAPMLGETAAFFHAESRDVLARSTACDYCRFAERRLAEERARAELVMHPTTLPKLLAVLERALVGDHAVTLVEMEGSGLLHQLEHDRVEDLQRTFRLFAVVRQQVPWRPPAELVQSERDRERAAAPVVIIKDVMKALIMRKGLAIVFDAEAQREPVKLVQALLDLRDKFARLVEAAFAGDRMYQTGLKEVSWGGARVRARVRDAGACSIQGSFVSSPPPSPTPAQAFENIVNRAEPGRSSLLGSNCVPEFLALYVDEAMKHDFKALPEAEVDERLNKVVHLFRFLSAKVGLGCLRLPQHPLLSHPPPNTPRCLSSPPEQDVFEEFYKQATAKRLLGGRVASDDIEKLMIGKLKAECGANYTNKLEGMFSDLSKSAAFMAGFKRDRRDRLAAVAGGTDIDVTVLTSSNWSSTVKAAPLVRLPPHIAAAADEFVKYYMDRHNGRKLQWNCSKGTAEVRARIGAAGGSGARVYELTVSTYQMVALMAFNASPDGTVSFRDLAGRDIPEDELRRHLLSLANPKLRLLNKSSASRDVEDADVFTVNDAFASKLMRIRVPLISMKSAAAVAAGGAGGSARGGSGGAGAGAAGGANGGPAGEDGDVMASVDEGRKVLLESVIVRIMKTRKHMEHNALVAEATRMVSARFVPQPADIKRRIEHLIDRDYLERAPDNHNLYSYLA